MNKFYKILKERQQQYDNAIVKLNLRHNEDPKKNSKINQLMLKNGELTSIIWIMEGLME